MSISVYIDPKQVEKIMKIPVEAGIIAFKYLATEVLAGMRTEPPIDQGALRQWQLNKIGDYKYKIINPVEYAPIWAQRCTDTHRTQNCPMPSFCLERYGDICQKCRSTRAKAESLP
jgi:hypothetical protein